MGVNTRDSQQMLQLADAASAGDFTAIKGLKDQLDTIYSVGSLYNLLLRGHLRLVGLFTTQQQKLSYHKGSNQWKK
jgi:hypothetical protein